MDQWKVRRGNDEFPVDGVETLKQWANLGRIAESDYIYNPILGRWMYARELAEIAGYFQRKEEVAKNENLNRTSWGLGCLGLLVCFFFWPAGLVLIIIAIVMSAFYHVKR